MLQQPESLVAVGTHTFPALLSLPLFGCSEKRPPSQILVTYINSLIGILKILGQFYHGLSLWVVLRS